MFEGSAQVTVRLLDVDPVIVGSGTPGGSATSVTVTVSVRTALRTRAPVPLVALTVTTYSLFPAALDGSALSASVGLSWFGAARNVSTPASVIENFAASAPPLTA